MIARRTVTMAILCTQRSCASHVEMFQYASEKNVDKWAIFRYAHYKIRKKKPHLDFQLQYTISQCWMVRNSCLIKNTTFFLLLMLRCKSIVAPFLY